ncbi:hypothetical protein [Actinomadura formosensis]|uniref:hypothetical protein n=1 Tax=Actinomadura formosensis TaxID=60706 RepID=UPI003D928A47
MHTVDSFPPVTAGALGIAPSALNPKNLLLVIAAAAIARTDTSAGAQAAALAVFVVIGRSGPERRSCSTSPSRSAPSTSSTASSSGWRGTTRRS